MSVALSMIEAMFAPLRQEPEDFAHQVAVALDRLEQMPVGPELAARLGELPPAGSPAWSDPHLCARAAARWTAVATWAEAQALAQMAAGAATVEAAGSHIEAINYITDVALETQTGEQWADHQVDLAVELRNRLPVMAGTIGRGRLTMSHARALARVLAPTDTETARTIDERVTPRAVEHRWTPSQLASAARRMLLRLDPDGGATRHEEALDRCAGVAGGPEGDGLAWLAATGDAVTVADILTAVDDRAERLQALAPDTPPGRVRFAALSDLILGDGFTLFDHVLGVDTASPVATEPPPADADGEPGACPSSEQRRRRRRRREVIVTVDLATLLGLREDPAQLAGFGPIPARLARVVATDGCLRRLVTDPVSGETLDLGRRSYAPSENLVTAIRAAQQTCQFPGCTRARRAEIDHRTDWSHGGHTDAGNVQLLCRRHHALKTAGLWNAVRQPDGSVLWTGPDGQTAIRPPDNLLDGPDQYAGRNVTAAPLADTG
jgi:hypothetical protein